MVMSLTLYAIALKRSVQDFRRRFKNCADISAPVVPNSQLVPSKLTASLLSDQRKLRTGWSWWFYNRIVL